jgi:hypothetical protein
MSVTRQVLHGSNSHWSGLLFHSSPAAISTWAACHLADAKATVAFFRFST